MMDDAEAWFRGEGYFHLIHVDARLGSDEQNYQFINDHGLCEQNKLCQAFEDAFKVLRQHSTKDLQITKLPDFHQPLFSCQKKFQMLWCVTCRGTWL